MKDTTTSPPLPYGWGAVEILHAMREDEHRYRRPRNSFTKGDSMPVKRETTTSGHGGSHR